MEKMRRHLESLLNTRLLPMNENDRAYAPTTPSRSARIAYMDGDGIVTLDRGEARIEVMDDDGTVSVYRVTKEF